MGISKLKASKDPLVTYMKSILRPATSLYVVRGMEYTGFTVLPK